MNKLLFYIFSLFLIVSCASDNIEDGMMADNNLPATGQDNNKEEEKEKWMWPEGVSILIPNPEIAGEKDATRALTFDLTGRNMRFSVKVSTKDSNGDSEKNGDCIGVFSAVQNSSQQRFVSVSAIETEVGVSAIFEDYDGNVSPIAGNTTYNSYYPYISAMSAGKEFNADEVPVTYLKQRQEHNVDINAYARRTESEELMQTYRASEAEASKHIGPYDYLVSSATSTEEGYIHFHYKRLGSVVRLFMTAPEAIIYDSLQFVNVDRKFMTEGVIDLPNQRLVKQKEHHMISLKFGELVDGVPQGFDLTNNTCNSYHPTNGKAYIIAYMMFAPIELKSAEHQCCIYLCGHDSGGNKKYYKSVNMSKFDLVQNMTQQWSPTFNPDEPITFNAISVEEWQEGTTFENEGGKGTEGW